MNPVKFYIPLLLGALSLAACTKDTGNQQTIPIPNGNFELWDSSPILTNWQTNSCPECVPPYDSYTVKKVTDASNGQFAAEFIYNKVFSSVATNKFAIALHPMALTGYVKSTIASGDTAIIHIDLFAGNTIVDRGTYYETASSPEYKKIDIPISQNSISADTAVIKIVGGKKLSTVLYVDNLLLVKSN